LNNADEDSANGETRQFYAKACHSGERQSSRVSLTCCISTELLCHPRARIKGGSLSTCKENKQLKPSSSVYDEGPVFVRIFKLIAHERKKVAQDAGFGAMEQIHMQKSPTP